MNIHMNIITVRVAVAAETIKNIDLQKKHNNLENFFGYHAFFALYLPCHKLNGNTDNRYSNPNQ